MAKKAAPPKSPQEPPEPRLRRMTFHYEIHRGGKGYFLNLYRREPGDLGSYYMLVGQAPFPYLDSRETRNMLSAHSLESARMVDEALRGELKNAMRDALDSTREDIPQPPFKYEALPVHGGIVKAEKRRDGIPGADINIIPTRVVVVAEYHGRRGRAAG